MLARCRFTATGRHAARRRRTHVLLSFRTSAPALLERTFKGPRTGRVLLWTTPLSRRPDYGGAMAANSTPGASCRCRILAVLGPHGSDGTLPGRVRRTSPSISRRARTCSCSWIRPPASRNSLVTGPDPKAKPRRCPRRATSFSRSSAARTRHLVGQGDGAPTIARRRPGLQRQCSPGRDKFDPLPERPDLDIIFGKDNYKLAEDASAHKKIETIARFGHEIFPWLMFLILIVVTLENFLANTFYKERPQGHRRRP